MYNYNFFDYENAQDFVKASGREYADQMAEVLRLALIRDASLYEWMILNFNDIMDKEIDAIEYIFDKISFIRQFFVTKDPNGIKERYFLDFGEIYSKALHRFFEGKYSEAECDGLGMIASAYISYKREMLSKEEFYELRDMFVPFGLTISLDSFETDAVMELIKTDADYDTAMNNFVLLKKIGKAVIASNVTETELEMGLKKLIVEWD